MAGDSQNFTKSLAEAVHQAERDVGREKMRDIDPPALDRAERKLAKAEARYDKWVNGRCY